MIKTDKDFDISDFDDDFIDDNVFTCNLIAYVKSKPVLWNHKHKRFGNVLYRNRIWEGCAKALYTDFDNASNVIKHGMVRSVIAVWNSIRKDYEDFLDFNRRYDLIEEYYYEEEMNFYKEYKTICERLEWLRGNGK